MTIREFIAQIAQLRVAKAHGDEILVYCPWHDDQNASLSINSVKGMYHCFSGCVKGSGGILSLFEKLDESGVVAHKYLTMFAADIANFKPVFDLNHDAEVESDTGYDVMSLPLALKNEYLEGRGITSETVRRFDLRYHADDDSIVIPIYIKNEYIGYVRRNISSNPKYLNSNNLPRDILIYPFDLFEPNSGEIYVCEGPFDAIKAHQLGLRNTVCTLGGVISDNQVRLLGELGSRIILVVDKDDSGIRISETNTKKLVSKYGFDVHYTTAPGQAKDFGEASDLSNLEVVSPYQLKAINRSLEYIIRS